MDAGEPFESSEVVPDGFGVGCSEVSSDISLVGLIDVFFSGAGISSTATIVGFGEVITGFDFGGGVAVSAGLGGDESRGARSLPNVSAPKSFVFGGRLTAAEGSGEPVGGLLSATARPRSTLLRCCLILLISAIQAGCWGGGSLGFRESGLLSALSSQLDLVGLHRFEGLGGGEFSVDLLSSPNVVVEAAVTDFPRLCCGSAGFTNSPLELSVNSFVMVILLELDPGREFGSIELPRLKLLGLESNLGMFTELGKLPKLAPTPLRLLAVEFCLLRPGVACALHLLLILSLRLSMAL